MSDLTWYYSDGQWVTGGDWYLNGYRVYKKADGRYRLDGTACGGMSFDSCQEAKAYAQNELDSSSLRGEYV